MRKCHVRAAVFVALCVLLPGIAAAQDTAETSGNAATAEPACELHVWPADHLRSTYLGWFHGGIVDGAVQGRDGYRKLPESPLNSESQAEILGTLPLPQILNLPGYRTVLHRNALDSRTVRQTVGRLSDSGPPCYAELVVDDVFFQEDVVNGKYLKALFRFRQFDSDTLKRRFGAYSQVKLLLFPPDAPEGLEPALQELDQAYSDAIGEFGKALNAPAKIKRGK